MQASIVQTLLLLVSNIGIVSGQPPCFSNLNDLSNAIHDKATFTVESYILCPDTVFNVGYLNSNNGYDEGDAPIPMRANSKVLCGEDGSSANNCVLHGGPYQVIATVNLFVGEDPHNVLISGLTFDSPMGSGALLVSPGDITFKDCIFRNVAGTAARLIYFNSNPAVDDERRLAESPLRYAVDFVSDRKAQEQNIQRIKREMEQGRDLQNESKSELLVAFESCKFEKNKYGGEVGLSVIEIGTPHVTASLKNSIFYKNDYKTGAAGPSYLIFGAQVGSYIEMEGNCFVHNTVNGDSIVSFAGEPTGPFENNFGTKIDGLDCQFIAGGSGNCIDFDATTCPLPFEFDELPSASSARGFPDLVPSAMIVCVAIIRVLLL